MTLLPCPFCSSDKLTHYAEQSDARSWYGLVVCMKCETIVHSNECWRDPAEAKLDIASTWNNEHDHCRPDTD